MQTQKKKVFVSFDFDYDKVLKDFIIDCIDDDRSPYEIVDWSMEKPLTHAKLEAEIEHRIANCDLVIVMVGHRTCSNPVVMKEVQITKKLNKPIVQIAGYNPVDCTPVPDAGKLYPFNSSNLKELLSS